jgi:hypothetical protein
MAEIEPVSNHREVCELFNPSLCPIRQLRRPFAVNEDDPEIHVPASGIE